MEPVAIDEIKPKSPVKGATARFVHSEKMTLAFWNFESGASVKAHSHPHEQVVHVLEGTLELTVGGKPLRLQKGTIFILPSGVEHAARAVTACKVLDVFHPVREDFK